MNVLVAFNAFKDSLSAQEACDIAAEVIGEKYPDWNVEVAPITDGGDGFSSILTTAAGGIRKNIEVHDALFRPKKAFWGLVPTENVTKGIRSLLGINAPGSIAVLEMAQASGVSGIPVDDLNPWISTSYGVGELLFNAVKADVSAIVIGMGGSATNDLGVGALQALGLSVFDDKNTPILPLTPSVWNQPLKLTISHGLKFPPIFVATDVRNVLLGKDGATCRFGPQKGVVADEILNLDASMAILSKKMCRFYQKPEALVELPGSGAAGGLAFGLVVGCDAVLIDGFQLASLWLGLEEKVAQADLIITGEGKFDETSFYGKAPGAVLNLAAAADKRCIILTGLMDAAAEELSAKMYPSAKVYTITPENCPLSVAIANAREFLEKKVREAID